MGWSGRLRKWGEGVRRRSSQRRRRIEGARHAATQLHLPWSKIYRREWGNLKPKGKWNN